METKINHIAHQEMLKQHKLEKNARLDRRDRGHHAIYKKDSEYLGIKTIVLPRPPGSGMMLTASNDVRKHTIAQAIKERRGIYATT